MATKHRLIKYIRKIAFSNFLDTCISILIIGVFILCSLLIGKWLLYDAEWKVVIDNLPLYTFGLYPEDQRWRPALWMIYLIVLVLLTLFGHRFRRVRKLMPFAWMFAIPLGIILLSGGIGLVPVSSRYWGGLTLTILLMSCSAFLAFPMGIVLAICRQSDLPIIKYLSSIYIDAFRAIPLIAILFFGQLLIPLFLPSGLEINRVLRAIIAYALFVAAYVAEDIRGGLQSIPLSQIEAAKSIGLSKFQINRHIILPQALVIALPALSNQVIGLLQNTSLMAILGLVELLGISRSLLANPEFIGRYVEVYVWVAAIYWLVCTLMALLSRHLEKRMSFGKTNL
tara:strand:- start:22913 stop:23932 length:1020 start_codon:yes stop_codon:yes gene_type:complete